MAARMTVEMGDITLQTTDAVVNAANPTLLGGGGVDGAIHRAAGPGLLEECRGLGGCETGRAVITGGYGLKARFVLHTVGPVWRGGREGEEQALASCYRSCLTLAAERGLKSVAFPAISTGAYGYPPREACRVALETTSEFLARNGLPERVVFVCFGRSDYDLYRATADEMGLSL
ncbi:MAG: O-acetyl-ADP-ribose deacetylase [Acidobacteriota bacterium]